MEEILASIRRIIADDEPAKPPPLPKPVIAAPPPPTAEPPAEEESAAMGQDDIDALLSGFDDKPEPEPQTQSADTLELTEAVPMQAQSKVNGFTRVEPRADVVFREPEPALSPAAVSVTPPKVEHSPVTSSMLSDATSAAVSAAFGSLTHTILSSNARTLEDIVTDMLRPMLKHWLDENLPTIVERLVRSEIERVSRGR
ncbi:hypothetical protein BVIRIDIS_09850 [Blastochloris viridis]|nr:hypothetical protein BVIRIDIS_09850 [Blastochloris viridis]